MPSPTSAAVPRRALVLFALLALIWGTNWPLFPIVLREMSVWSFRSVSMIGAGVLLLAIARFRGQSLAVPRKDWPVIVAASVMYLVVWNVASAHATVLLPSGQAAVLGFTMPVWAALIAWGVLGERLSARQWLAVGLAALGVVLLMQRSFAAYADAPLGLVLGLVAGIGWAIGTLILGRAGLTVPATVLTGWQLLIAAVPITGAALFFGHGTLGPMPSPTTMLLVLYITLVPMAIGNVAWFSIVGLLPASIAGLSSITVPVVAMISGALIHREPLGVWQWAAMASCGAALAIMVLGPRPPAR